MRDSNPRPFRCKRTALPTELIALVPYIRLLHNTKILWICNTVTAILFDSCAEQSSTPQILPVASSIRPLSVLRQPQSLSAGEAATYTDRRHDEKDVSFRYRKHTVSEVRQPSNTERRRRIVYSYEISTEENSSLVTITWSIRLIPSILPAATNCLVTS